MLTALADWPHRPTTPQAQLHSALTIVVDGLYANGASKVSVDQWADKGRDQFLVHCMIAVEFDRGAGKSMTRERELLAERLRAMGLDVRSRRSYDLSKTDFFLFASAAVDPVTKRLKSGALPRPNGATDDLGDIVIDVDKLNREYELHHLQPS